MNADTSKAYDAVLEMYDRVRADLTGSEDVKLARELSSFFAEQEDTLNEEDDSESEEGDEE